MSARSDNPSVDAGLSRAWYAAQVGEFLNSEPIAVIGHLAANGNLTLVPEQKDAWLAQVEFLQAHIISGGHIVRVHGNQVDGPGVAISSGRGIPSGIACG